MYGLDSDQVRDTFGVLYAGLDLHAYFSRNFWNILLLKRLLLALIISASVQELEYLKFMLALLLEAFLILIIVYSSPLSDGLSGYLLFALVLLSVFQKSLLMILWLSFTIVPNYQPDSFPLLLEYVLTCGIATGVLMLACFIAYETYVFVQGRLGAREPAAPNDHFVTESDVTLLPIKKV